MTTRLAIGVGINHYVNDEKNGLQGCDRDVAQVLALLKDQHQAATEFDVEEHVDTEVAMTIPKITTDQLRDVVKKVFNTEHRLGIALFYFSGHGAPGANKREYYLISSNAKKPEDGLPMREVLDAANECVTTQERIIILDCCHSGHMGSAPFGDGKTEIADGVTILASARKSEEAIQIHSGGLFTRLLIEALQGGAADVLGEVTLASIYHFIDSRLHLAKQQAVFKASLSKLITLRQCPPRVEREKLKKALEIFDRPDDLYHLDHSHEEYVEGGKVERRNPYDSEKGTIYRSLQVLNRLGLVEPVGHTDMFWAAVQSLPCQLTLTGKLYWHKVLKR